MPRRRMRCCRAGSITLAGIAALSAAALTPAGAQAQLDLCLSADPPPATGGPQPLRFGITPQLAGTVGGTQGDVAPEDPGKATDALHLLQPPTGGS